MSVLYSISVLELYMHVCVYVSICVRVCVYR